MTSKNAAGSHSTILTEPKLADPRTLDLADYLTISKLNIPTAYDWTTKKTTPWGMMGNWALEDCTCAAAGHMIECWTANATNEVYITDDAVLNAFIALSGYNPVTGVNDKGVGFTNLLKYWRNTGIGAHKIKAYTAVKYIKDEFLRAVTYLFGGAYVALALPNSINTNLLIWDVLPGGLTGDNAPGSGGYHAVAVLGYDDQYLTFISYGQKMQMTWAFWNAYSSELYAVISDDFFIKHKNALGFDMDALEADLIRVSREKPLLEKELVKNVETVNEEPKPTTPQPDAITTANAITIGNLQVMAIDIGQMNWQGAMIACNALGDGWHLPTQDELNQVYLQQVKIGRFSINSPAYWSSTYHGVVLSTNQEDTYRYYQMFNNGTQATDDMNVNYNVRAVKVISEPTTTI